LFRPCPSVGSTSQRVQEETALFASGAFRGGNRVKKKIPLFAVVVFRFVFSFNGFQQRYRQQPLQHLELQRPRTDNAKLQLLDDPVERRFGHGLKSATSAVNFIPMPPKLAMLKEDEATISRLGLMKCFLKLKSRARRKELIALTEPMVEEESKYPAEVGE
jgi:hypothetical protein